MAKLVITRGLPASGKSTAVEGAVKASEGRAVRVGRDFLRDQLFGTRLGLTFAQENLVSLAEKTQVKSFLKAGIDVYVDAMHLKNRYVTEWAKLAAETGAELVIWDEFLQVPLEKCIERDAQRDGEAYLGADAICNIHSRFFPIPKLNLTGIEKTVAELYVPKHGLPPAYMVDIDGTVTEGPYDRSPYEWKKVGQDKARASVITTVFQLYHRGYDIIFCSGRDAVCRPETIEWLAMEFGPMMMNDSRTHLFMRKENDNRKDSIVKLELFNEHIRDNFNVVAVFDDRDQVVEMWRSIGLTVFQVAPGAF